MFKSLSDNVRAFFANSENEICQKRTRITLKRKREDVEEDDPDVQIIKVEKKRKVDNQSSQTDFQVLRLFKQSVSAMANWINPKHILSNTEKEKSDGNVSMVTVSSKRNGIGLARSNHNGDRHHQNPKQFSRNSKYGSSLDNPKPSRIIPIQQLCRYSSQSSDSSIFGRQRESTANACIRLKEKEEYSRLIRQNTHRSPWQRVEPENTKPLKQRRDSDVISICSNESVSVLGSTNKLNSLSNKTKFSTQHNVHKISQPSHTRRSQIIVNPSLAQAFPCYTPAPLPSSQSDHANTNNHHPLQSNFCETSTTDLFHNIPFRSLMAKQRRQHSTLKSVNKIETQSSNTPDVIVVQHPRIENHPIVVEDDLETNSRVSPIVIDVEENKDASLQSGTKKFAINSQRQPEFLKSRYITDSYLDLHHFQSQSADERRRQIEEQACKAKAYAEKRRAQEKSLEKQMKYKMKIFDEEPEISEEIFIDSDEEEDESLPELTSDMEEKIAAALRPGQPSQILSEAFRLQITRRDIATLGGLNWLNDEIINFYMNLLIERGEQEGNAKVYAFNTFFYPKIMNGGHQAVRRWTKKVDIFAMNYILIPVHLGMHWCLCVANMKDQVITYYDSMGGRNEACVEAVRKYVNDESMAKRQTGIKFSEWKLVIEEDIPQQMNGSDCGMFTCKYAEYITRGKAISFTQEDMPYFRRRMVYEILTKKLMQ